MIDGLFPLGEVHLIAGCSGGGKSTWLYRMLNDWQHERDVLGRRSTWYPFVLLINDRSRNGTLRTLQRLNLNPNLFPVESGFDFGGESAKLPEIISAVAKKRGASIVVVEGLQVGMMDSNDYAAASNALQELNRLCQEQSLTILGTTHVSKQNAEKDDRNAVLGSVALGAMTETVVIMRPFGEGYVKQTVHPRNEAKFEKFYVWDEGDLRETDAPGLKKDVMADFLQQLNTETFYRSDVIAYFESKGKSDTTADRDTKKALKTGWIAACINDRTGKAIPGSYRKLKTPTGFEALAMK
jgi:hypothetical protein